MDHEAIHGPSMPPPMGHNSQAVRVGNLLFIAGQPGIDLSGTVDPDTARAVPGGFEHVGIEAILDDAGSGLEHVVKTTTFLTDLDDGRQTAFTRSPSRQTLRRDPRLSSCSPGDTPVHPLSPRLPSSSVTSPLTPTSTHFYRVEPV
jgi:enamine deaminase RidA (YjgF/YER057c/UK114 family)